MVRNLKEDAIKLLATKERKQAIGLIKTIVEKFDVVDVGKFTELSEKILEENKKKIDLLKKARKKAETSTFIKDDVKEFIGLLRSHEAEQKKALHKLKSIVKERL
jgi:hypothetical protein